jgi:hypothetical protein
MEKGWPRSWRRIDEKFVAITQSEGGGKLSSVFESFFIDSHLRWVYDWLKEYEELKEYELN